MTKDSILTAIINNEYDLLTPKGEGIAKLYNDICTVIKKPKKESIGRAAMLIFILTMPNKGSWDGKWSGDGKIFCAKRKVSAKYINKILQGKESTSFYYSWPDGWGANVEVKKIEGREAAKMMKKSKGFCGYEWMIDSIIHYQDILSESDRKSISTVL